MVANRKKKCALFDKNDFDMLVNAIPEATEDEREARRLYEASLPPINQENINKYRIG